MKKVALLTMLSVCAISESYAYDGTINFTGEVVTSTCQVNGGATPATLNVALAKVGTTALKTAGSVADAQPVNIALTSCPASTKVATFFEPGTTVDSTTGNLINTFAGGASNVQIQLLNAGDKSAVKLGTTSGTAGVNTGGLQQTTDTSGATTFNYLAQYYATAAATAGKVTSLVNFTITYP